MVIQSSWGSRLLVWKTKELSEFCPLGAFAPPPSLARSSSGLFLFHRHCSHSPAGTQPQGWEMSPLFAMTTQTTTLSRSPDWRSPWERAEAPQPLSNLCHIMGGQNNSHMSKIPALHTPTALWTELAPEANPEMFQEFEEQEDDDTFMNVGPNFAEKIPCRNRGCAILHSSVLMPTLLWLEWLKSGCSWTVLKLLPVYLAAIKDQVFH